ncbi:MAG: F0F1 ATP synthase subunit gamma, partial [Planctomycetota bacterium]|nr:F0F1 ATP synthase subunit gamma [Planctomycetota bacterium]
AIVSVYAQFQPLPDVQTVLEVGLPLALRMRLYQAFIEAALSEHTARLMAMKAATTNAEDMIRDLTQEMNRARQARITAELSEIVGGADAVEGVR